VEARYRKRYVDLFANDEVMKVFEARVRIVRAIRAFLDDRGFLEVETPMMQPNPGGAAARPFLTHHNALDTDLYLRIAPELYLKRLLVGGMEKVYEINRNFRNEGISTRHSPEFTMLEVYEAYGDYRTMMELTEALITNVADEIGAGRSIRWGDSEIDLSRPWPRERYADLLERNAGVEFADREGVLKAAKAHGVDTDKLSLYEAAQELFEETVEKTLVRPTFVVDYPTAISPLAKVSPSDPEFAERFELFIGGMEIAPAYSELNDPIEQERRFAEQLADAAGEWAALDSDFIEALRTGMPPAGGLGIGIDRLVMLFTDSRSIRDVILFPLLRPAD
jgi:lysyl-tRNA synthetase class 2